MTTATHTAPLTAEDVRTAIEVRTARHPFDAWTHKLGDAVVQAFDPVGYHDAEGSTSDIWTDLRNSEGLRLAQLVDIAAERTIERVRAIVIEEVVAAALAFAAEYPDAPRATGEVGA